MQLLDETPLVDVVTRSWRLREENARLRSVGATTQGKRLIGIPKLEDANKAGTKEAPQCTLIITEGDSAKALAVAGLSVVGRDYYGVYPLRGKFLNVRDVSHERVSDNKEVAELKKIIGLRDGNGFVSLVTSFFLCFPAGINLWQ